MILPQLFCHFSREASADSGTELFELDWAGQSLQPGQQVRLQGTNCSVTTSDIGLKIAQGPVVNNDGCHPRFENSGASYLEAGRHPFKLVWFNCRWAYSLRVSYEGPGLPRQRIPNS